MFLLGPAPRQSLSLYNIWPIFPAPRAPTVIPEVTCWVEIHSFQAVCVSFRTVCRSWGFCPRSSLVSEIEGRPIGTSRDVSDCLYALWSWAVGFSLKMKIYISKEYGRSLMWAPTRGGKCLDSLYLKVACQYIGLKCKRTKPYENYFNFQLF